jgi:hypothetical protein
MRTRVGVGATLVLGLVMGFVAPANAASERAAPAGSSSAFGPGPDSGHVDLLDLDDLVDDLLFLLGLRDHGSNETSLLDVLGLTDDDAGDTPPAPAAPPAPQDLLAIIPAAPPGGDAPAGPEQLLAIIPAAPPGGDSPAAPGVTPEDLASVGEISGLGLPALPPSA